MIVLIIPVEVNTNAKMSVLQNLKEPIRLQCKMCGREWVYRGRNPYRARCAYCGTTVMVRSSRVDR